MPHGIDERLGYVIEVCIDDGETRFLHTSDAEGLCLKEQRSFIIENDPDMLFIDGPLTYMLGYAFSESDLERSIEGIGEVLDKCDAKKTVIDHHLLRDLEWKDRIRELFESGRQIMTAAEFAGEENIMLEARREELHGR